MIGLGGRRMINSTSGNHSPHPAGYPWRVALQQCPLPFHRLLSILLTRQCHVKRCCVLTLPFSPLSGFLQFPLPFRKKLFFPTLQFVFRGDIPDGAKKPNGVVMVHILLHQPLGIL